MRFLKNCLSSLVLLALVLAASPASAQLMPGNGRRSTTLGTIGNGSLVSLNDVSCIAAAGIDWATVKIQTGGSWVGTITPLYRNDANQGIGTIPAAYVKRLDVSSANPAVTATMTSGGTAAYELPLAGDTTHVCLKMTAYTSGSATIAVTGLRAYVPGVPVSATLYHVTSAVNTALDTGVLELAGWTSLLQTNSFSGGVPSFVASTFDETGTSVGGWTNDTALALRLWSRTGATGTFGVNSPALGMRMKFTSAAIAAQTSGILLQVFR